MPYDYVVDTERGFVWVRYSGVVSVAERHAAAEHILSEVTGPEARHVLLDYRQATSLTTDETQSTALADYLAAKIGPSGTRVAWLVNYDHQLDGVVEAKSRERGVQNARFRDFDEAMAWLLSERTAADASGGTAGGEAAGRRAADASDAPEASPMAIEMLLGTAPPERRAQGTFEVKVAPQSPDNPPAEDAKLARLSIEKRYSGPLDAIGQGEMLADGGGSRKDGAYVALERVTGKLHGRAGSFALVHRALMRDGTPEGWSVVVVPGSGTDALAGLEGSLKIRIEHGKHFYDLEYSLPA